VVFLVITIRLSQICPVILVTVFLQALPQARSWEFHRVPAKETDGFALGFSAVSAF
jgi:hypothetical protein